MSHKTHYKTFTQPDSEQLEKQVNDFIHTLYKDEKMDEVKINDVTTFSFNNALVAAITYSYGKPKKPNEPATNTAQIS